MKKITLLFIISCFMLAFQQKSNAQTTQNPALYQGALGLKFDGYENGISGKYFMNNSTAVEGVLGFRKHGLVITGLYEIHQTAFGVNELKFYYGAGAHIGSVGKGIFQRYTGDDEYYDSSHVLLGADGVLGLEYLIPNSPIAISLDLNPRLELAVGPYFDIAPGLGIKYCFK
ncbi:hypothetical protein HH214_06475 [Mucilaginibacter robiniae]|uniref:DUF3575 domain-containing protein n=1 Tax=Mucilaginibacter robiniae TaxID=2728022 RepID=A0A7L5DXQ1_9SPHI|nr:hypothetical protein [Mucilaginibacter robiniae]QJD95541.1 hypothetical protein HH214_06475 [Mucilaginibacter robiniae]